MAPEVGGDARTGHLHTDGANLVALDVEAALTRGEVEGVFLVGVVLRQHLYVQAVAALVVAEGGHDEIEYDVLAILHLGVRGAAVEGDALLAAFADGKGRHLSGEPRDRYRARAAEVVVGGGHRDIVQVEVLTRAVDQVDADQRRHVVELQRGAVLTVGHHGHDHTLAVGAAAGDVGLQVVLLHLGDGHRDRHARVDGADLRGGIAGGVLVVIVFGDARDGGRGGATADDAERIGVCRGHTVDLHLVAMLPVAVVAVDIHLAVAVGTVGHDGGEVHGMVLLLARSEKHDSGHQCQCVT